jgi:PEP-CTERM motif
MLGPWPEKTSLRPFQPKNTHTTTMKDTTMKNKYCQLMRATLLALFVTTALVLNTTAIAQAPPGSLWYNGDWNHVNELANERNTLVSQAAVYDDFNVTATLWNVTAVFSDNVISANAPITGADWEIRTGISEGNAGTLIASGTTNSPIVTLTGRSGMGFNEYMVEVTGLNVFLPMLPAGQHYWLNVTPVGPGFGRSFNTDTSGANCVGTPCGNDQNAFFNSTFFDANFTSTANQGQPTDFSMGVIGNTVPEPATVALLTCGLGLLLIALRRRRVT